MENREAAERVAPEAERLAQEAERLRLLVEDYAERLQEAAELMAYVRHEINNPLTGIIGQAQLLLRGELEATTRRRVETIEQLAIRIRDTVAQLRTVPRPASPAAAKPAGEAAS